MSAAISVAKALIFQEKVAAKKTDGDLNGIELAVNAIEQDLKKLDDMETWTNTIQSNSGKILKQIGKLRTATDDQVERLRSCLAALKSAQ